MPVERVNTPPGASQAPVKEVQKPTITDEETKLYQTSLRRGRFSEEIEFPGLVIGISELTHEEEKYLVMLKIKARKDALATYQKTYGDKDLPTEDELVALADKDCGLYRMALHIKSINGDAVEEDQAAGAIRAWTPSMVSYIYNRIENMKRNAILLLIKVAENESNAKKSQAPA